MRATLLFTKQLRGTGILQGAEDHEFLPEERTGQHQSKKEGGAFHLEKVLP